MVGVADRLVMRSCARALSTDPSRVPMTACGQCIVTIAWLVTVLFVVLYVAVAFTVEVIFGIRLQRGSESDGPPG